MMLACGPLSGAVRKTIGIAHAATLCRRCEVSGQIRSAFGSCRVSVLVRKTHEYNDALCGLRF